MPINGELGLNQRQKQKSGRIGPTLGTQNPEGAERGVGREEEKMGEKREGGKKKEGRM